MTVIEEKVDSKIIIGQPQALTTSPDAVSARTYSDVAISGKEDSNKGLKANSSMQKSVRKPNVSNGRATKSEIGT